ncbi:hypothetical protein PRIPAC_87618, partial [Pristionchus pacificus]|uniref:Cwf21 domain-containing protein n=1 Tax=Pristionchus pacificus TaxID=54126 RepID=A0A2A6CX27_PRIPA
MYNGIGLQTARGTGTNGYIQGNLSHLLLSRRRVEYNAEEDIARAEAALARKPNEELLDHQRKRQIEIKVTEFEMLMENKGFEQEDIDKKVADYRRLLLSQLESGELNVDDDICLKDSHARQKYAAQKRAQWKEALKIDKDFKPGSSMQNMNKEGGEEDAAALAEKAKAEEPSLAHSALPGELEIRRLYDSPPHGEAARLKKLVKVARKEQKRKEKEAKKKRKEKVKKEVESDEGRRGDRGVEKRDKRDGREETRYDRRREDDRRPAARAREDSRERRRARNSSSEREQRRRSRRDSSAEEERGRRQEGGKDKEIKQEPASSDSEAGGGRQESANKSRRPGSRSASPYVDSDMSDDTRSRMRSMVTVVK